MYSEIQDKLFKLYQRELIHYFEEEKSYNKNSQYKLAKHKIDRRIIQNMIETLNIQILVKLILKLFESLRKHQGSSPMEDLDLEQMSPIKLDIFR